MGLSKVTSLGYSSGSLRTNLPARHLVIPLYPICFCPACSFKGHFALTVCWSFLSLGSSASFLSWLCPWGPSSPNPVGCFLPNSSASQECCLGREAPTPLVLYSNCVFSAKWVTQRVQNKCGSCLWTCFLSKDTCVSLAFFRLPQRKLLGAVSCHHLGATLTQLLCEFLSFLVKLPLW